MNFFPVMIWATFQVILFVLSVWFIVYGIRIWNDRKFLALIVFTFAFTGVLNVIRTLMAAGFL